MKELRAITLSDLREHLHSKLGPVMERDVRLVVTNRGQPMVVILSISDYGKLTGTPTAGLGAMANLRRFDLVFDKNVAAWVLRDQNGRAVRGFSTKEEATEGGVLADTVGEEPATVRVHNRDGTFEEERTFPRSADPRRSPG